MEAIPTALLPPLARAIELKGSKSALGAAIGVSASTITYWLDTLGGKVPGKRVEALSNAIDGKITPHEFRPDLFPAPSREAAA